MHRQLFLTIGLVTLFCFPSLNVQAETRLRVGTAKVNITPPVGTPLAGYGKRHGKPSQGILDPLFARALSLSNGREYFVFISTDLVLIDNKLRCEVLKKINRTTPLKEEQLLLFATHTHSGAGAIGGRFWQRFIMGKHNKHVFDQITDAIAAAAVTSLQNSMPAQAEYAETDISPLIENRLDEKKSGPHILKMLRFRSILTSGPAQDSRPEPNSILGSFIFMSAHSTLLPASHFLFSADFPGVITALLEKKTPESVHLFVNGAAGDLRPKAPAIEDRVQRMHTYGEQVMEKIQSLKFEAISLEGPWKAIFEKRKLPRVKVRLGFLKVSSWIGGRVFPRHSIFHVLRTGPYVFLSFPGELSSDIGREIERQSQSFGLQPFMVGYAQDYIAYVVPKSYYRDLSQYESQVSFYGSRMDWFTEETLRQLTWKLLSSEGGEIPQPAGELTFQKGLPVLRLQGDAYQIGFEEGRLMKKEIRKGIDGIFSYFRQELPIPLLNRLLINLLANRAWKKLEPYVSYEEYLQMKGIAEGSGISFKKIKQIHALPEIYPALCTNGAYWNEATVDGRLIAIRNLDWNRKMGIQKNSAIKWIQIPGQKAYANIGYLGFVGVLSGINEEGLSVGQIGATSSDETMSGTPMPFLLRRVLAQSGSLEDAERIVRENFRTRGYNYLFADAKRKQAIVMETTAHHTATFVDNDPKEKNVPYSCSLENAVFRGDPALDPVIRNLQTASGGEPKKKGMEPPVGSAYEIRYQKHGQLVKENYGKITPQTAQEIARQVAPGSNIQSVIYAYPEFFVANASRDLRAAETDYHSFNIEDLKSKKNE